MSKKVDRVGLEPTTFGFPCLRSYQLSYQLERAISTESRRSWVQVPLGPPSLTSKLSHRSSINIILLHSDKLFLKLYIYIYIYCFYLQKSFTGFIYFLALQRIYRSIHYYHQYLKKAQVFYTCSLLRFKCNLHNTGTKPLPSQLICVQCYTLYTVVLQDKNLICRTLVSCPPGPLHEYTVAEKCINYINFNKLQKHVQIE